MTGIGEHARGTWLRGPRDNRVRVVRVRYRPSDAEPLYTLETARGTRLGNEYTTEEIRKWGYAPEGGPT